MPLALALRDVPAPKTAAAPALSRADRRTLSAVLGFLAGLAFLGPPAALAGALLGAAAARLAESR